MITYDTLAFVEEFEHRTHFFGEFLGVGGILWHSKELVRLFRMGIIIIELCQNRHWCFILLPYAFSHLTPLLESLFHYECVFC